MKLITSILFLFLTLSLSAKPKPCIGYWIVTYDTENGFKRIPTFELVDVYTVAETMFPSNCIDFKKELKEHIYVEIEVYGKAFYVEVKKINRNGKFRSLSKKEIKEYFKL